MSMAGGSRHHIGASNAARSMYQKYMMPEAVEAAVRATAYDQPGPNPTSARATWLCWVAGMAVASACPSGPYLHDRVRNAGNIPSPPSLIEARALSP